MRSHPSTEYTIIFHRLDGASVHKHSMAVINCKMMPKLDRHHTYSTQMPAASYSVSFMGFDIHIKPERKNRKNLS